MMCVVVLFAKEGKVLADLLLGGDGKGKADKLAAPVPVLTGGRLPDRLVYVGIAHKGRSQN